MIERFQIEDLIVQDTAGVTFRAMDTVTRTSVAVRRFFPFGVDGGGLQKEEEVAYNIGVDRLAGVKHPQLRAVITGGCDPIDAIPYIATEWVEGRLLSEIVGDGALSADDTASLAGSALEVCELLSQVLAEEAIWVETGLHTIIVADPAAGRGATFWISPLKWLGGSQSRGYEAIIDMVEEAMGWQGRIVGDQAGRGLGSWLKWLRTVPATTPLREVRESLAAAVGAEPPVVVPENPGSGLVSTAPTVRRVTQRMISPAPAKPKTGRKLNRVLVVAAAAMVLAIAGGAAWWSTRSRTATGTAPAAEVIPWDKREELIRNDRQTVTITGRVSRTDMSKSGKTIYLLFSDDARSLRVGMPVEAGRPGAVQRHFQSLVGKPVRATGQIRYNRSFGDRPEIILGSKSDVKVAE